ncbi:hypothetical protein GCM10010406_33060 [Streptomyces thermolineatus]|uniref:Lipoprotein n=1 Tax=Streptomyces thermolineatus TaxID=44033 RepID=A0ABN3M3X5_9ACTN
MRRTLSALAAAVATAGLLAAGTVTGCGAGTGASAGEDWKRLEAGRGAVAVSYPPDWRKRGNGGDGAEAVLERDGRTVARLVVKPRFMTGGTVGVAAAGAMASLQPGAKILGNEQVEIDGREAERIRYSYEGDDGAGPMRGLDVVALDADDEPLLVRITAGRDAVDESLLERIADSVELG